MTDWYLDPPEVPELPECCGDVMEDTGDGGCTCAHCGRRVDPPEDPTPEEIAAMMLASALPDPWDEGWPDDEPPRSPTCPHGHEWGSCATCDHESDLAYDAARERGHR